MKEYRSMPGDHISEACDRLVAQAPAFMVFNGIRLEATGAESAKDLVAKYHQECERQVEEYRRSPKYAKDQAEANARQERDEAVRKEALDRIERSGVRTRFPWTEAMYEISGFGGAYEAACRDMVYAGLAWLAERPTADLTSWETPDAKALEKAVLAACPDCSGAMHGAAMSACAFVHKQGWDTYVAKMTERAAKREKAP